MREIKFRIYSTSTKRWYYSDKGNNMTFSDVNTKNETWRVMQYTGLKDKNGVEIYEGDILRDEEGYISRIYWCEKHRGFADSDIGSLIDLPVDIEVAGNIYENPELFE